MLTVGMGLKRFIVIPIGHGAIVIGLAIFRVQANDLSEVGDGIFVGTLLAESIAAIKQGGNGLWDPVAGLS